LCKIANAETLMQTDATNGQPEGIAVKGITERYGQ
jgi:hypothetical protein